ncbi:hypothetical protein JCM10449v2_006129 [Rhodotorula kratochvilovae]
MAVPRVLPSTRRANKTPSSAPGTLTATSLHQRILFPPSSTVKPPRILHSSAHATLDPLILDFIALALRAYVTPWYNGGISRDPDKAFLQAVTAVLVHVIQALEVRLATVDWTELLVRDVPELVAAHYRDWDLASERAGGGSAHNLSPEQLFHNLQPHIAISLSTPSQASSSSRAVPHVDKVYLRTLVDHILRLLLPPEDYRAETERAIVREILVGVVFGAVYGRIAQPWFLHGIIARQLEAVEAAGRTTQKAGGASEGEAGGRPAPSGLDKAAALLASLPGRLASAVSILSAFAFSTPSASLDSPSPPFHTSLLSLVSAILPSSAFLSTLLSLLSLPLAFLSPRLDAHLTRAVGRLTTESTVRSVLEGAMRGMFPNEGWPAPKEDDPDEEAQAALQERCEAALARLLPDALPALLDPSLPSDEPDPRLALARHLLRPLTSHVANVHLFVLLVDLVVGRVFPELVVMPED